MILPVEKNDLLSFKFHILIVIQKERLDFNIDKSVEKCGFITMLTTSSYSPDRLELPLINTQAPENLHFHPVLDVGAVIGLVGG